MNANISFTQKIKEELATQEYIDKESIKCIIAGFTSSNGRILIQNKETIIHLSTEHAKVAKLIYTLYQQLYSVNPQLTYSRKMKFDKKVCFNIFINNNVDKILDDLEINLFATNTSKSYLKKDENIKFYLVGCLLACGSCNDPISSNYHLELSFNDENHARYVCKLMNRSKPESFEAKIIQRRSSYVVYMKKSDLIVDFLAYLGAHDSCLEFEEVRVERDFRNNDNRLQICENANVYRTISSAKKQIEDIKLIDEKLGIHNMINNKEKILCMLRLENEELSMVELADLLSKELNTKVSKSNVNHLFRSIHQLAERFRVD